MKKKKCSECGEKLPNDAELRADPYIEEMTGKVVLKYFCDGCYKSTLEEI